MNRNQFHQKHQFLRISENELDRKYRTYLREQEEQMMIESAARLQNASTAAAVAGSGGGGQLNPTAITPLGESIFVIFTTDELENWQVLTLDSTDMITNVCDLGVPKTFSYYYYEIMSSRGVMLVGQDPETAQIWFSFVDAGGNLIQTVQGVSTYEGYWSTTSNEGLSLSMAYRLPDENIVRVHSWYGTEIWVHDIPTPENLGQASPYTGYFSYSDCLQDGSFTLYWYEYVPEFKPYVYLIGPSKDVVKLEVSGGPGDEQEPWNSAMSVSGKTMLGSYWDGSHYTKMRVWQSDGSYSDYALDPSVFNSSIFYPYGTDKYYFILWGNPEIPWTAIMYDNVSKSWQKFEFDRAVYNNWDNQSIILGTFSNYVSSPEGAENATLFFFTESGYDGTMYQNSAFKCLWRIGDSSPQTYTANTEEGTFDWSYTWADPSPNPVFFCHRSGSSNLELMHLGATGATFTTMETTYANLGSSFNQATLGENTFLVYVDNSREGDTQYCGVWHDTTELDHVWLEISNWTGYQRMVWIYNTGAGETVYFTPLSGEFQTYPSLFVDYWEADWNGWGDWKKDDGTPSNQLVGTVLVQLGSGEFGIISESQAQMQVTSGGEPVPVYVNRYVLKDYILYLYAHPETSTYTMSFYDLNWNLLNTISTESLIAEEFWCISHRNDLLIRDGNTYTWILGSPSTSTTLTSSYYFEDYRINDWRWWVY